MSDVKPHSGDGSNNGVVIESIQFTGEVGMETDTTPPPKYCRFMVGVKVKAIKIGYGISFIVL